MNENNLSESKIININDFIFRQNLEFYPNLSGLNCENNTLSYKVNGTTIMSENLSFDLRTLPGDVWSFNPNEFINVALLNNDCKKLSMFFKMLNENVFNNLNIAANIENTISYYMQIYFKVKESNHYLTEDNKQLLNNIETMIAIIPDETLAGKLIANSLDNYFEQAKASGNVNGKANSLVLRKQNLPSIIEEEKISLKSGFINIAILLYGMINIGMIIALALIRN